MLPFILRNESKFKLFSDQVVQVMENLEKHEINPFALENFAEKCVLKLVEPFSSHCLAVWQHKTWRSQWLEQDNEISLYTERVHQQRCLLC